MSSFKRVIWIILDAAGFELTRRCLEAGVCPALSVMAREGYLGPTAPSEPNCQTPPALRALTAGTEPSQNGIWGFLMPRYQGRLEQSISGFAVRSQGAGTIWDVLESRGQGYTLINTAFRKDRVWSRSARAYDLVVDGYRRQRRRGELLAVGGEPVRSRVLGAGAALHLEDGTLRLRRPGSAPEILSPGEVREIRAGRRGNVLVQWPGEDSCFLFPSNAPHQRLNPRLRRSGVMVPRHILHGNIFRFGRSREEVALEHELEVPFRVSTQVGELALELIRALPSRLFMFYFSLIDELSHAYLDQIEASWPAGRGSEIARRSYAFLDAYLGRMMDLADPQTLVAVSSDHGQAPFRRIVRLNELFLEAGLVRAGRQGYDLKRSPIYYHPADCGQVVVNRDRARRAGMSRENLIRRTVGCLEKANSDLDAHLGYRIGAASDPYLLFLYPLSDTHITGKGFPGGGILDNERKGGHHLSPYCPSPWIRSLLGLWSPAGLPAAGLQAAGRSEEGGGMPRVPRRNTELKDYLSACLGIK